MSNKTRRRWALDAKSFFQLLPISGVLDANLCGFLKDNEILELSDYDTSAHHLIRKNSGGLGQVNRAIPLMKHKESFDDLCDDMKGMIRKFEVDDSFTRFNDLIIHTLGNIEKNGIYVDAATFEKHFNQKPNDKGLVFSQYNVYTSTGRPSNRFGGVNYAALNHKDGSRSSFVSRYGKDGCMVVIDYTAFHPRIICNLTDYPIPVETDIYEYLAKLYFQKKEADETDITNAKLLTFRQLYGGVEEKYAHIKYLANLKMYIDEKWDFFQKNGYVPTPIFGRKITDKHIQDPNPAKLFNYILQAVEGEVSIPKVQTVLDYLHMKKTKAVLYTYDAVLYDFHRDDGIETLREIRNIMSSNGAFPMKTYMGHSYHDVRLVSI
ncbi:MAG TPA: hypothetical protein VMW36_00130 [Patescibacteria group bacterium]|nr:hypothetical protein [Patescibacteria group bacterium]